MSAVSKVLNRTLVKPFYQANAGFFLITIGLLFGFLKTPQHIDIATALAFNPLYYAIPFSLFIFYTLKTLQFCYTAQRLPANQFMGWLVLLKPSRRIPLILAIQTQLLLPVIAYSGLLLYIALQHELWLSVGLVIGTNLLLVFGAAHFLHKRLLRATDPHLVTGLRLWANRLPKPIPMLFIHQLFSRQAVLLLGTKMISIFVLVGAILIFEMEGTDYRLLTLGLLLSGGINSVLSIHYQLFEQKGLALFKNLPMSSSTWFSKFMLTYFLLFIPEMVVFLGNSITQVPINILFGNLLLPMALLCFYQAVLYRKSMSMDNFIKYPFFTTATLFFAILGYLPAFALVVSLLGVSYLVFIRYYRKFELVVDRD